jgi:2-polyprenyl-3-methyl-5-hydroxy-6-metoxy-1,4-benzoquinol methylase
MSSVQPSTAQPTPSSQPKASSQPTPERIFEVLNGYQQSAAMKAAIELDVFTAIAEGNKDSAAIAHRCNAAERGIRILCDFLAVGGLITKQDGKYGLAPDAAMFLSRKSPAYMGSVHKFLLSPATLGNIMELTTTVKNGTISDSEGSTKPENPIWVEFARSMAPMMVMPAEMIAKTIGAAEGKKWKVLDIAAGHGLFGVALARHNPNAEIVALDWPAVLEVAKENAAAAGVANRYRTLPGSAFDVDFGAGYDVILLTNFLHHFDVPTNEKLLRRVHAALAPGGRAVALEFVPNEDRISPPMSARFSMVMLAMTVSGDAYTHAQYQKMFSNTGFKSCVLHAPPVGEQLLVAEK